MAKILIFSRSDKMGGGVVNFVEMLKKNISNEFCFNQFVTGRRNNISGRILRLAYPIIDATRLLFLLTFYRHDAYHINPSLNVFSLVRDGLFLLVLRMMRAKNVIVSFHGWDMDFEHKISQSRFFRKVFLWVFGYADKMLVLADDFKKWLVDIGFDEDSVYLFTTMFDGDEFLKIREAPTNNRVRILFLSRLVRGKGIYELLDAFTELAEDYPNVQLIIAGNGPEEQNLLKIIQERSLGERVEMKGYIRDEAKVRVYYGTDLFVLPSYSEGCPISLLEAMAAGLPVVTTTVGSIPRIVRSGVNGILLNKVSVASVEKALRQLLDDTPLRKAMGMRNFEDAWAKYSAKAVTPLFERLYAGESW